MKCGSDGKEPACNVGDPGSIPGSGRSPGEGNGNPLQCSCLENAMDGGAWRAIGHGVAKSRARLSDFTFSCRKKWGSPLDSWFWLSSVWDWPATPTWCVAYPGNLLGPSPSHRDSTDESNSAWWKQKPREAAGAMNRLWRMGMCSHTATLPSDLHFCTAAETQKTVIYKYFPERKHWNKLKLISGCHFLQ